MSSESETKIDAVIRLPNIALTRGDFESLLGIPLDRFEPSKRGAGHYGQLNTPAESGWRELAALLERVGPAIQDCSKRGDMEKPEVDIGWTIPEHIVASSLRIPEYVTSTVARFGFDLVVSAYVTE